jgi:hypothetical protein
MPQQLSIRALLAEYTADPFLGAMWRAIRTVKPLRSISLDVTRNCNLRCKGCYFFAENMDASPEADESELGEFIERELSRGTNFVTVIGGEPSLAIDRLRRLSQNFRLIIVTNGLKRIPMEGLEHAAIAVSMWGDRETDRLLRGANRLDIFDRALANYLGDHRVAWYITLPPSPAPTTAEVIDACVREGHLVGFNFYGDVEGIAGQFDHRHGFEGAREFVRAMIQRHPTHIAFSEYLNTVISTGQMQGLRWGYEVCGSISADNPKNIARIANGQPYSPHFRAYNPDLRTTRRCCVGEDRDCRSCFDVWAHMSWITLNLERHLRSVGDFADWLTTVYLFYGVARLVDQNEFRMTLPLIHEQKRDTSAVDTCANEA